MKKVQITLILLLFSAMGLYSSVLANDDTSKTKSNKAEDKQNKKEDKKAEKAPESKSEKNTGKKETTKEKSKPKPNQEVGKMVLIPAGKYTTGDESLAKKDKSFTPQEVNISSFYIDETEVTNQAFETFIKSTKHKTSAEKPNADVQIIWRHDFLPSNGATWQKPYADDGGLIDKEAEALNPVVLVTWSDAKAFCNWANKRLPTNWEWEYVAGGQKHTKYSLGDEFEGKLYNYKEPTMDTITNVHKYPANSFGVKGMSGGVWEWTDTWFDSKYFVDKLSANPQGPTKSSSNTKVLKGGSWHSYEPLSLAIAWRYTKDPETIYNTIGFRCAADLSEEEKQNQEKKEKANTED